MSSVSQGLTPTESYQELTDFARRCGENALRLAMHAAVPQTFRASLLHLLKLNFLHNAMRDPAVEADVLLAPFTEDLSGGYYQFDSEVRRQLLERLNAEHKEPRGTRLERVARFLAGYIAREEEKLEVFADPLRQSFLDVQRWVTLAHLDPDSTARQLAYALEHTEETARAAVRLQIGGLIRSLSAPLAVHPELLIYAAGLRSLEEGRFQEGQDMLKRLGQGDVVIAGVKMRAVDMVLSDWKSRLEPAPQSTGTAPVEHGTILIVTKADAASWIGEPLYQHWVIGGFQPECLRMEEVWFTKEDVALRFATGQNVAFLILDEQFLDLNQERVSAIFGLPSLPVIPVWRPRLAKPAAREQYLSQRVQFGWWVSPIEFTQDTAIAERIQASVAAIRAWTTAPENGLDVALQQLDFFQQYQPHALEGLWERVESGVQTLRQVAQDAINRGDLARARALLQNADTALKKKVGGGAESFYFYIRADLAEVLTKQGEFASARTLWEELLNASRIINSNTLRLRALAGLGEAFAGLGEQEHAREILTRALALARELDDPRSAEIQVLLERLEPAPPEQSRTQRAGDVFFAYSRRDKSVVLNIREYLERRGVPCWSAPRDIPAGTEWLDEITRAIELCRVLIVILSSASNNSEIVAKEVRWAIAAKKPILPIRLEAVEPSEALGSYLTRLDVIDVIDNLERQLPVVYNAVESLISREQTPIAARNKIFVSYSHKDSKLFDEFKTMMAPVIQSGLVDLWDDRQIQTGAKWKDEIQRALASAQIAVLLVSQNFLASPFIAAKELPPLLKAAQKEGLTIFWIYLSSCLFEQTEIASYQAAHDISRPLDRLSKSQRQAVLSDICAKLIRTAADDGSAQPTQALQSRILSVFVSSTSDDLVTYRKAAQDVILDLQWRALMMEHFVALPEPTLETCYKAIDQADLVLLIVAWRQGWVPTEEQGGNGRDSVTALELAYARTKNIPVLILLAAESWPGNKWENDEKKHRWVEGFRENLNQVAGFFEYEQAEGLPLFCAKVKQTLVLYKERMPATLERAAPDADASAAFLSYSREDSSFALRLAQDLKAAGANVWIDQVDIEPGQEWDSAIEDAMTQAARMLLILSPTSVKSRNVRNEVSFALEEKKTIIPVLYQDCTLPLQLRRIQHIDFRHDYGRGLGSLLKALGVKTPH